MSGTVTAFVPQRLSDASMKAFSGDTQAVMSRIAELEARISALIAGSILPADGADEITVDGVKWVRVPAESTVRFIRNTTI